MNKADQFVSAEVALAAVPEIESIAQQFKAETVAWLPSWYKAHALRIATENREHSESLGKAGLLVFKTEVEQLAAHSRQIVDSYLDDGVWWHHDQGMDTVAVIYAVRLCMGRLALPLHRAGYIRSDEWREVARHYFRTRHEKDEHGAFMHREEMVLVPVPTRRHFFSLGQADAETYDIEDWSPRMNELIRKYFSAQLRGTGAIESQTEQRSAVEQVQSEARIKAALDFGA